MSRSRTTGRKSFRCMLRPALALLAVAAMCASPSLAGADEATPVAPSPEAAAAAAGTAADRVELSVSAVLASKKAGSPAGHDPGPAPLDSLLRKAFPDYRYFTLLSTTATRVELGKSGQVPLPNGLVLDLGYQGMEDAMMRLELSIPPRLKTSMRVSDGGTFFQAGMPYSNGVLVLAITARKPG